jgi:hypothetical protein
VLPAGSVAGLLHKQACTQRQSCKD